MNEKLHRYLAKKFEPNHRLDRKFNGKDLTIITNENGIPVTLFIGKRRHDGDIAGERYVRYFKTEKGVEKSHWERKGRVGQVQ